MKKPLVMLCLGLAVTGLIGGGCGNRNDAGGPTANGSATTLTPSKADNTTIATFHGERITMDELQKPLVEAYGLNLMLNLVQLHAAQAAAARRQITITEADVVAEHERNLLILARDNNPKLMMDLEMAEEKGDTAKAAEIKQRVLADSDSILDPFLAQKRLTRPEWNISMRTNAYLRKLVEPSAKDAITDKMISDAFRYRYGEKVQVAHIQLNSPQEVAEVKKRLARGEDFGDLAVRFSKNDRSGPLRGELPPFSRQQNIFNSQVFVDTAFALKVGEVSDMVNTGSALHLIKLLKRIDPVAVKEEDVREPLRKELHAALVANYMGQLRNDLFQAALASLKVTDPTLKEQYDKWREAGQARIRGNEEALRRMNEMREAGERALATQPAATQPATTRATAPVAPPMEPATKPASTDPVAPAAK